MIPPADDLKYINDANSCLFLYPVFSPPRLRKMKEALFLEGASFFYSVGEDSRTFVQLLIDDGFGRIICEVFDKLPFVSHLFEDVDSLPI